MEYNFKKSTFISLEMPGLLHNSQIFAIPHETLHFSQKCLKDRWLLSVEKIASKKSHIYLSFDFFWSSLRVMRPSENSWRFFYVNFFYRLVKSENTENKSSNKNKFMNVLPEFFFSFFNERVLVVPQLSYNVLHLIYWCKIFSIHKNFKALIVWRNRFNLRPQTLSSSSTFPDKSGESQSRKTTDILLFP